MFVLSVIYCLLLQVYFIKGQSEIGDACTLESTGVQGECVNLVHCESAVWNLRKGIYPQRCGFEGTAVIACCPDNTVGGGNNITPAKVTTTTAKVTTTTAKVTTTTAKVTTTTAKVTTTSAKTTTVSPVTTNRFPFRTRLPGEISKKKCEDYSSKLKYKKKPLTSPFGYQHNASIDANECGFTAKPSIVGGTNATRKEFPHTVLIGYENDAHERIWACGGSLISELYVLTAGHCLYLTDFGYAKFVKMGMIYLDAALDVQDQKNGDVQERKVGEIVKHPDYYAPSQYNDIALLKLKSPVILTGFVRPACLNVQKEINHKGAIASGFGKTRYDNYDTSAYLLKVTLNLLDDNTCTKGWEPSKLGVSEDQILRNGINLESMLCAGGSPGKDTCQGDSGGPLQVYSDVYCMYDIVGVTSFGTGCGVGNVVGVYTRVSNYIKWIEDTVWP